MTDLSQYPEAYREICQQVLDGYALRQQYGIPHEPPEIGFDREPNPQAMQAIQEMAVRTMVCSDCQLADMRNSRYGKPVPGAGSVTADVMIVGEAPGYYEEIHRDARAPQLGLPFVGPAGKLLDKILLSIGLKRSEVFITNVLACRPPKNRDPYANEIAACSKRLHAIIALIRPWVIIAMGRFSAAECIAVSKGTRIGELLGKLYEYRYDPRIKVWPMKHPAYLLRQTYEMIGYYERMRIIGAAIAKARALARERETQGKWTLNLPASYA